jgi:hypothetical protein
MSAEFTALAKTLIATVSETLGVQLTFDSDSVKWLDGYIERVRAGMDESQIYGLSNTIGAFLGECIISNYGGSWRQSEDGNWGVFFDDKNVVFPFAKAYKQLACGKDDSIFGMYNIIPVVFNPEHIVGSERR